MSSAVKWGLITGVVYVLQSLISNLLGIGQGGRGGAGLSFLIVAVFLVISFLTVYMGIKEIRDHEMNGMMNTGLALRKGLKITLIGGIIAAIYTLIYTKIIDPGMMDRIMAAAEDQWEAHNMTEDQIAMSKKVMSIFMNPYLLAPFTVLSSCFWGIFQSLIAGVMLKKEAPPAPPPSIPTV